MQLAGKLADLARVTIAVAGLLMLKVDEISGRRFSVTQVQVIQSSGLATAPHAFGPSGQLIPRWGERLRPLQFQGQVFSWPFLLAAVDFPMV
jgi:hypothetical protein